MFCPMQLDCKSMTGIIYHCPNLDECLENSPLNKIEAIRLYYLNQGVKPEELLLKDRPNGRSQRNQRPAAQRGNFIYNRDSDTRDRMLFGGPVQWAETYGGIKNFSKLSLEKLQQLIAQRFVDPTSAENNSPTIREFSEFAQEQALRGFDFYFEGYAISPEREDYHARIEGIVFNGNCPHQLIVEFQEFVGDPDELELDPYYLRAWWDYSPSQIEGFRYNIGRERF